MTSDIKGSEGSFFFFFFWRRRGFFPEVSFPGTNVYHNRKSVAYFVFKGDEGV